jgi:D-alanyl-D-alanine carboxypeptidase/D-alanyl-D-alanine-endopeptidase (penicillin-binding protein 4)
LLAAVGTQPFNTIVLDTSHFADDIAIPGIDNDSEAYNALNSALAANFNKINAVRSGNEVRSAEAQTPITPLAISQFRQRGPNGTGRISLAQENPDSAALHAGELIAAFIRRSGGSVVGGISIGSVPAALEPAYVHRQSRPLLEIVRGMLMWSNNYIANQIFLVVGVEANGRHASIESSQLALGALLNRNGLSNCIRLVEGSGISRQNQITAQGLVDLLARFAPYAELMEQSPNGSRYKTGTLDDVSTLAGYAQTREHGVLRFVIALPGGTGHLRFRILEAIEDGL